jgi:hypothetical protein
MYNQPEGRRREEQHSPDGQGRYNAEVLSRLCVERWVPPHIFPSYFSLLGLSRVFVCAQQSRLSSQIGYAKKETFMGYYKSLYSSVDVRIHTEWYLEEWEISLSNKKKKEIFYIYYPARCKYIYTYIYRSPNGRNNYPADAAAAVLLPSASSSCEPLYWIGDTHISWSLNLFHLLLFFPKSFIHVSRRV